MAERIRANVAYIQGWSFGGDIKFMLLTLPHVLVAENAH